MVEVIDPHALSEEDFYAEVHSFQFWLEAVEGYLGGTDFGSDPNRVGKEFSESGLNHQRTIGRLGFKT